MDTKSMMIESIGWVSTGLFLLSILVPNRIHLHQLGVLTSITTGIYAYSHDATAIWVKWVIAFFFHGYMIWKSSLGLRSVETNVSHPAALE
ncbi:MAG: hypothetical protein NTV34_03985 [Proteobacteria bacterium]|nr:hypothetical protein [Pseudomonadota bacterium]